MMPSISISFGSQPPLIHQSARNLANGILLKSKPSLCIGLTEDSPISGQPQQLSILDRESSNSLIRVSVTATPYQFIYRSSALLPFFIQLVPTKRQIAISEQSHCSYPLPLHRKSFSGQQLRMRHIPITLKNRLKRFVEQVRVKIIAVRTFELILQPESIQGTKDREKDRFYQLDGAVQISFQHFKSLTLCTASLLLNEFADPQIYHYNHSLF